MMNTFSIWITGLSGSGKTTIANLIIAGLRDRNLPVVHLESDELRKILTPDPDYSESERDFFYKSIADFAVLLNDNNIHAVIDATANKKKYRDYVREKLSRFIEIYIHAPLELCEQRDPKGLYRKAREGKITTFPGIHEPYEEPDSPEVVIDSSKTSPEDASKMVLDKLASLNWIS